MDAIKGNVRRMYLSDPDLQDLKKLSDDTNLGQTELLTQIVHAGLASIKGNGNRILFPLKFSVAQEQEVFGLNEPRLGCRRK